MTPDIVTMAKGLSSGYSPISATAVSARIVAALSDNNDEFAHGFTYSGHPTAAAVALKNLEIIEREELVKRVATDLAPIVSGARALAVHPLVGEARSLGLIGGVEIVSEKGSNRRFAGKEGTAGPMVRDFCIANGLMVRAIRDTIVMCPPLVITHAKSTKWSPYSLDRWIRRSLHCAHCLKRRRRARNVDTGRGSAR